MFCNLAFFLPFLRDRRNARFSFRSFKSGNYIRFLKPEKVFTLSHDGPFRLIFRKFGCEGLDFQVFTAWVAWMLLPSWISTVLLCEGLQNQPFTVILLSVWTLGKASIHTQKLWKSAENTRRVKGWILFSGNQMRIHARARRGKSIPWAWLGRLPAQIRKLSFLLAD